MGVYRKDIDGLRAFAVIPVIFFHMGIDAFSGGYVGVDVFFVISGYLITSIIADDALNGRFDILDFYERRIRRIFPALFSVVFVSSIISYQMLLPVELKDFGQSVLGTTLFSSNILFWLESGYFDAPAESKPLLHTWSLAVEEQFYLVYPLLLVAIIKMFQDKFRFVLLVSLLVSFLCNLYLTKYFPSASFYLSPGRMWELLLGALIALGYRINLSHRLPRELLSMLGFFLILYAIVGFDRTTTFPGIYALFPCVGTALIINAGIYGRSVVSIFLSWTLIVWIGLLSYSLYLWHWPIIVFTRLYLERPLLPFELSLLFIVMFIISVISWRFIERPFRNKVSFKSRKKIFIGAAGVMTIAIFFGVVTHISNGLPGRVPEKAAIISKSIENYNSFFPDSCFMNKEKYKSFNGELCHIGHEQADKETFILWGDSHARAMIPAVVEAANKKGLYGFFAGHEGCPPLLDIIKSNDQKRMESSSCQEFNDDIIKFIQARKEIKQVILVARWTVNLEGTRLPEDPHPARNIYLYDKQTEQISTEENILAFKRGLDRTLNELIRIGKDVVIVGPVPEAPANVSMALARASIMGFTRDFRPVTTVVMKRIKNTLNLFEEAKFKYGVNVLYPHHILCAENRCLVDKDGIPLYFDDDHLSVYGSTYIADSLAKKTGRETAFFD